MKLVYKLTLTAALSAAFSVTLLAAESGPVVNVAGGKISGVVLPGGVVTFKGIPYAAPPVGPLRWRAPQPVVSWKGIRETTAISQACTQNWSPTGYSSMESRINGEDCLYLNVWTSEWPSKSPKAVLVWPANSATGANYLDGAALSRRGVIVVTLNARAGIFGFFAHPELTAESPHHTSGNYGYLDQIAALQWVQDNISKFGGDPKRVTFGTQSTGAMAIASLLTSPLTKGLVTRAIQESGAVRYEDTPLSKAEEQGVKFANSLMVSIMGATVVHKPLPGFEDPIEYLRSIPGPALVKLAADAVKDGNGPNTGAVVDGWVLPGKAVEAYEQGKELPIPILIGGNAHEHPGPATDALVKKSVGTAFGSFAPQAEALYGIANGGAGNIDSIYGRPADQLASLGTSCGAAVESNWHVAAGNSVYFYQFDHAIAGRDVVDHNSEQGYVFGNLTTIGWLGGGPYTDVDRKISDEMGEYWTNFMKTGDPNGPGLPVWPKYDAAMRPYIEFTDNGPVAQKDLRGKICDLYLEHLKKDLSLQLP